MAWQDDTSMYENDDGVTLPKATYKDAETRGRSINCLDLTRPTRKGNSYKSGSSVLMSNGVYSSLNSTGETNKSVKNHRKI